jgi:transposase
MQTGVEKRQVFDLPERLIEVTEHQASIYCCAACGFETKAEFPAGLAAPAQYGERIRAAAIYLNVQQLIPEDRVARTMNDLFGAPHLCPASLAAWVDGKAAALAAAAAHIGVLARQAPVRHLDENRVSRRGQTVVAGMLCDDTPILADDDAIGVGMDLDWTTNCAGAYGVFVVVEPHKPRLKDGQSLPKPLPARSVSQH